MTKDGREAHHEVNYTTRHSVLSSSYIHLLCGIVLGFLASDNRLRAGPGFACAMPSPEQPSAPARFVQVSEDGTHFVVDGRPFFFAGANCYYLMVRPVLERWMTVTLQTLCTCCGPRNGLKAFVHSYGCASHCVVQRWSSQPCYGGLQSYHKAVHCRIRTLLSRTLEVVRGKGTWLGEFSLARCYGMFLWAGNFTWTCTSTLFWN